MAIWNTYDYKLYFYLVTDI